MRNKGRKLTLEAMKYIHTCLMVVLLALGVNDAKAQYNERMVDSVCTVYALLYDFDGAILVADNNKPVFEGAFGYTGSDQSNHVTTETQFCITGLTNLFTAAMVLKLIEDGDLYFDETLDIFFPKEKIPGKKFITIENLLTYSSGLPNNVKVLETTTTEFHPVNHIASLNERRLDAPPGEESVEKHIDYILLGLVVERIMGKPWNECLKELVLDPCGMTQTGALVSDQKSTQLAASYHVVQRPLQVEADIPVRIDNFHASGAMYSTIGDMFKFDQALYENKILSKGTHKMMLTQHPDFKNVGLGWKVNEEKTGKKKNTIAMASGKVQGYNALWMRFEEDKRSIILLSNSDMVNIQDFAQQIRKALYPAVAVNTSKGKK